MWLGLYFLSHKQYVEVRCYSKETLEITPELTWCANISVSLSPCSCHHRRRDTSSEEEIRNSTREQKQNTKERRRGLLIFNRKSTRDCRSQPWGTPTKKVIKNKVVTEQSKKNNRGKNRLIKHHHCFYCISGWLSVLQLVSHSKTAIPQKEWPRDHPSSNLTLGKVKPASQNLCCANRHHSLTTRPWCNSHPCHLGGIHSRPGVLEALPRNSLNCPLWSSPIASHGSHPSL